MNYLLLYLGHGRALETYIGLLKIATGITLALTDLDVRVPAFNDITWYYSRTAVALPFLIVGGLQIAGTFLNIKGIEFNWVLRATGAICAIFMWTAILLKTSLIGQSSLTIPLATVSIPASIFLFWKAWNRLPIPGAQGLV